MHHDAYADIAELYDLEHGDFTDDIEFITEIAGLGVGPILELGCGTGRILLPLADAGYEVVGIDASEPMLKRARGRIGGRPISLVQGDMSLPEAVPGGPFGLILVSLNSIMHLTDPAVQRSMLAGCYASLKPGGRVMIDTLNPGVGQLQHLLNTTHHEGSWQLNTDTIVDKWGHRTSTYESQIMRTLIWYDLTSKDGTCRRIRTEFEFRYVHQSELALMLEIAGFSRVDWYGSYDLDSWHPESERIIAIAHKD